MGEYTALTRELFFDNVRRFNTHVVMDAPKIGLSVALERADDRRNPL